LIKEYFFKLNGFARSYMRQHFAVVQLISGSIAIYLLKRAPIKYASPLEGDV
jgi:hypothetical protein